MMERSQKWNEDRLTIAATSLSDIVVAVTKLRSASESFGDDDSAGGESPAAQPARGTQALTGS